MRQHLCRLEGCQAFPCLSFAQGDSVTALVPTGSLLGMCPGLQGWQGDSHLLQRKEEKGLGSLCQLSPLHLGKNK